MCLNVIDYIAIQLFRVIYEVMGESYLLQFCIYLSVIDE